MKRNSDFLLREVAGTLVVVPVGTAAVAFPGMITLNATSAFLWELLETEQTVQSLTEALTNRYAVEETKAREDVEGFLKKLLQIGAVED